MAINTIDGGVDAEDKCLRCSKNLSLERNHLKEFNYSRSVVFFLQSAVQDGSCLTLTATSCLNMTTCWHGMWLSQSVLKVGFHDPIRYIHCNIHLLRERAED